jgi:hypothetical protein
MDNRFLLALDFSDFMKNVPMLWANIIFIYLQFMRISFVFRFYTIAPLIVIYDVHTPFFLGHYIIQK